MDLIAHGSGMVWPVSAGSILKITDMMGSQTGDVFAVAADDLEDGQSNGRSFNLGDTIRMSTGSVLYSRRSRPLLKIVEDEVGAHDFLYAPCSPCFQNMTTLFAAHGVPASTVTTTLNIFMNVAIGADGSLDILPPLSTAGQSLTFTAERDVLVAITACPSPTANAGSTGTLGIELDQDQPGSITPPATGESGGSVRGGTGHRRSGPSHRD